MQKLLSYIALILLSTNTYAQMASGSLQPRIGISPPRIELQLNESGTANGEFTVINTSNDPIEIGLSIYNWDLDENNNTRLTEPTEQSLDQWLIINPLRFRIAAKDNQTIRFGIRPQVQPEVGEHRAIVYVREVPAQNDNQVRVRITYGLPIYANYGEVKRIAKIHNSQFVKNGDYLLLNIDVSNPGKFYTRPDGAIAIWKKTDYPGDKQADTLLDEFDGQIESADLSQPILSKPILPSYRREQKTNVFIGELENGEYIARAKGYIGENLISKSLQFSK